MDCLKFLQTVDRPPFDVVFIDPPYLKGLLDPLLQYIPQCPMFSPDTLFIIERQKRSARLEKCPRTGCSTKEFLATRSSLFSD